jgi:hypothetical protein
MTPRKIVLGFSLYRKILSRYFSALFIGEVGSIFRSVEKYPPLLRSSSFLCAFSPGILLLNQMPGRILGEYRIVLPQIKQRTTFLFTFTGRKSGNV